jgi:rhodanese-related sulfurtransferase
MISLLSKINTLHLSALVLIIIGSVISSCNAQVSDKVDYTKAFLVDVRTPQEFSEGHAAGSINIPLNTIVNQIDKFQNKGNIVVFCRSGSRSSQALKILEEKGIKNVSNGGTWQQVEAKLKQAKPN